MKIFLTMLLFCGIANATDPQNGVLYNVIKNVNNLTVTGTLTGSLTGAASLNVLKAGDTMTGQLNGTSANYSGSVTAGTGTITGNAFSVGTSTFVISAGNVGIGTTTPLGIFDVRYPVILGGGIDTMTVVMLHMDGANNSTAFTDSEITTKTITGWGNAKISTTQSEFGGASANLDGTNSYVSISTSSDFNVASGNFTVDFWFYTLNTARQALWAFTNDIRLGMDYHNQGTRNINIWASSNGTNWDLINADPGGNGIGTISLTANAWHHIAVVRNGNNWRTYLDGVKDVDITVSGTVTSNCGTENLNIGRWGYSANHFWNSGYIDEFRFSKGIARWTAPFTPPTLVYSSSSTVPTNGLLVTNTGNVGIGTTSPSYKVDVSSGIVAAFGTGSGFMTGGQISKGVVTASAIPALVPIALGAEICCSNCSIAYNLCVATGTLAGAWVISGTTSHCQ